ncbi:MAG: glutamine-hydrolyzing carbamoyl-phosphate synthase small subunit [Bacteroidia bacterium]|nr:glutamine-hydrolyzing carbamoyl-phosphate synthase small subunit [Bacteroidia bacterium]
METIHNKPAILLLEDGTFYRGRAIGKIGTTTGELCFNTGMTGYQEVFTDPSYYGQILVQTNVHIGNYGASNLDMESSGIKIAGLVCKTFSFNYSRKMAGQSIDDFFVASGISGIQDVDTREIVRHVRDKGAMNAIISSEITDIDALKAELAKVPSMDGLELSSHVTTNEFYTYGSDTATRRIAVLDYGVKRNMLRCLSERDNYCGVFTAKSTAKDLMDWKPDGVLISNGPGDPAAMDYAVDTVKELLDLNVPMFGICLGNQLLGKACGLSTFKMHNGHRGLNHPVLNLQTGRSEITSQNHGFALRAEENPLLEVTHINLNDNTIEGIRIKNKKAFSVQYHPESSPGPHDSRYLFDDFINMIKS